MIAAAGSFRKSGDAVRSAACGGGRARDAGCGAGRARGLDFSCPLALLL